MYSVRLLNAANVVVSESTVDHSDLLDEVEAFESEMTEGWTIEIEKLGD